MLKLSNALVGLALAVAVSAQGNIPTCQQNCQQSALSGTQCGAISLPCGCDTPYQEAMLKCLSKPTSAGGCTYGQIISWMSQVQSQCFQTPPILPPCLTVCPLQAQETANCSSETDSACICGTVYTSAASSCIKSACGDQFQSWNSGHLDFCNGATPSGPISGSPGGTTTTPGGTTAAPSQGGTSGGGGTSTGISASGNGTTPTTTATSSVTTTSNQGSGATHVKVGGLATGIALVFVALSLKAF